MWIMLYDCFFSIVKKDCANDELMVRARRPGDIEKIWKNAKVSDYQRSDYRYRAAIKRADVIAAIATEIEDIDYDNFKSRVGDDPLHRAYLDVWVTMSRLQPTPPYGDWYKQRQPKKGKKK